MGLDPISWAVIGGLVLGAGGAMVATGALGGDKKSDAPAPPQLPPTPSPDTALADAQTQADDRRRAILATGGTTTTTSPSGAKLAPTQVAGKTLLGS